MPWKCALWAAAIYWHRGGVCGGGLALGSFSLLSADTQVQNFVFLVPDLSVYPWTHLSGIILFKFPLMSVLYTFK